MRRQIFRIAFIITVCLLVPANSLQAFDFEPGHFYTTYPFHLWNSGVISEYDSEGRFVDSFTLPVSYYDGEELRGLGFGPDGLLYVVVAEERSFRVEVLDSSKDIVQTYPFPDRFGITGNKTFGKIDFDTSGHFYVSGGNGLARFEVGDPSSGLLFPSPSLVYDLVTLPDDGILVACGYDMWEIDSAGVILRQIPERAYFSDLRSVEYDYVEDAIFVGMSAGTFLKLDGETGEVLASADRYAVVDLFLTNDRRLVTAWGRMYDTDLNFLAGFVDGGSRYFITECPIPEPATLLLLGLGAVMVRRKTKYFQK